MLPSFGRSVLGWFGLVPRTYHRRTDARKLALLAFAGVAAGYALARWRPFRVEVEGPSMRPALEPGDWAIAIAASRVRPGDVVVVEHPQRPGFELVKRVIAITGGMAPDGLGLAGAIWVEGDAAGTSSDSRRFGPVPLDRVRGRIALVWWPPGRLRVL